MATTYADQLGTITAATRHYTDPVSGIVADRLLYALRNHPANVRAAAVRDALRAAAEQAETWLAEHPLGCRCESCRAGGGHVRREMTAAAAVAAMLAGVIDGELYEPDAEHAVLPR